MAAKRNRVRQRARGTTSPRPVPVQPPAGDDVTDTEPVVVVTPEQDLPLRPNDVQGKRAHASVRAFQRAAMQWAYIVRNRRRWAGRDALIRDQADDAQKLIQRHFQVGQTDLGAVAQARVAQVAIPFRTETEGWENRLFPWEFVLSAATRPLRQGHPLTLMRQLVRDGGTPGVARTPRTVLYVESAPDKLAEEYDFESERTLLQTALAGLKWQETRNPTRAQLQTLIERLNPDIIHLAGFDTHQGLRVIERSLSGERAPDSSPEESDERQRPPWPDGYILSGAVGTGGGTYDPVDAIHLAKLLCAGRQKPLMVTCALWNSASRTCPLIVAEGAAAALGVQDSFDDAVMESFLSAFYTHWRLCDWKLADAFSGAWEKTRQRRAMVGTGVVLWSDRRLVGADSIAMQARASKLQKRLAKESEQLILPDQVTPGEVTTVSIKAFEELNYSLLHNRRPMFETFKFVKTKPGRMEGITVFVELNAGGERFPYRKRFDITTNELDLRSEIHAPLIGDLVRSSREPINTSVFVEVTWADKVLYRDTHAVRLLPADQWRDNDEDRKWLPCFVLPRDPAVGDLIEKAHRYVRVLRDDPASGFDGYQSVDMEREDPTEDVDLQVQAIWSTILHEWELGYINPPPTYSRELDSQRLRTPTGIFNDRNGTCIDLALLVAACLELVGIYPVVFLLEGHAFPGYWRSEDAYEQFLKAKFDQTPKNPRDAAVTAAEGESWISGKVAYDEIVREIDRGNLVPLESVKLTENCGFWEAVEAGRENLLERKEFHSMIDVLSARTDRVTPLPFVEVKS